MADQTRVTLEQSEIPEAWYNILPRLPFPPDPPLHPGTREPIGPEDLAPLFPMGLIAQEVSTDPWIDIPGPVMDIYARWRPTPLLRATRLEEALGTPAQIWYKYEGVSPAGSHKPNTAIAQAFFNKEEGVTRIATETGAGQWGSSLAFACALFDIECKVYMVKSSFEQKPYRRLMIETWGASVIPSPSTETNAGRAILDANPDSPGSLGIAISEAVEDAASREDTKYSLGSVLNHVLLHQTVEGLELQKQLEKAGLQADVLIACCGGGSNLGGFIFPFLEEKIERGDGLRFVAVEPASCPTLTAGKIEYDFGDTAGMTPLLRMYTLGHEFVPPAIHAGGLRYHGDSPLISGLAEHGYLEAVAYPQGKVFEAAVQFARTEGYIPAPESAHAVRAAVDEALRCKEENSAETIVFNLSGNADFDLAAYDAYLNGRLESEV